MALDTRNLRAVLYIYTFLPSTHLHMTIFCHSLNFLHDLKDTPKESKRDKKDLQCDKDV